MNDEKYLRRDLDNLAKSVKEDYVNKDQFDPVKRIVYGLVSLILIAVVGALIALVIK